MVATTKVIVTGDLPAGRNLIGYAQGQLSILKRQMEFQNLNEGYRTVTPWPGVTIEAIKSFRHQTVRVHVAQVGEGREAPEKKEEEEYECLCLPHFAFARITAVYPESPSLAFLRTGKFTYDIEICNEEFYLLYEGAEDLNFGRYYVGQFVLATIGEEMSAWNRPLDCDRECLNQDPQFDTLAISPIETDYMDTWYKVT